MSTLKRKPDHIVDADGSITIDFSNLLLPMKPNTPLIVKIDENLQFTLKPISTALYFKYNEMMDQADDDKSLQRKARIWLVSACIVEPEGIDVEKMEKEVIGIFYTLFNTLMNMSFLQKTV